MGKSKKNTYRYISQSLDRPDTPTCNFQVPYITSSYVPRAPTSRIVFSGHAVRTQIYATRWFVFKYTAHMYIFGVLHVYLCARVQNLRPQTLVRIVRDLGNGLLVFIYFFLLFPSAVRAYVCT